MERKSRPIAAAAATTTTGIVSIPTTVSWSHQSGSNARVSDSAGTSMRR
jgi:hypothetical protein